jgi:hypothetical protein
VSDQKRTVRMQLTADQLGTLITLSAAAAGSIIVILVNCITNSRCSDISIAWGCFHCIRQVPPDGPDDEDESGDEQSVVPPDAP